MNRIYGPLLAGLLALAFQSMPAVAQGACGFLQPGEVCANPTGSAAPAKGTTSVPGTSSTFIQSGTGTITRTMQDKARDVISLKDWAKGDSNGSHGNGTDDTTKFQSALDHSTNGTLYVPCGIYRITAGLTGNGAGGTYHIRGEGECSKIFNDSASATTTFQFAPAASCSVSALQPCLIIEGVNFITPNVSTVGSIAIAATNEPEITIRDSFFNGYYIGIGLTTSFAPKLIANTFTSQGNSAIASSSSGDTSFNNGLISNSRFYGNGKTSSASAIDLGTTNGGLRIEGNNFDGNFSGIVFNGGHSSVRLISNYFENACTMGGSGCGSAGFDVYFNSTNYDFVIQGNRFGSHDITTSWVGLTNSIIGPFTVGGSSNVISCDATSVGNTVFPIKTEGGATFTCPAGNGYGTTAPAISACGTGSPAVTAGSTNLGGQFITGTGAPSACTITFDTGAPFANNAFCTVSPANAAAVGIVGGEYVSASTKLLFTITLGAGTSSAAFNYVCQGH